MFDYKINNSNIKQFYDRIKSNIILFTLVVGMSYLSSFGPVLRKETYQIFQR